MCPKWMAFTGRDIIPSRKIAQTHRHLANGLAKITARDLYVMPSNAECDVRHHPFDFRQGLTSSLHLRQS